MSTVSGEYGRFFEALIPVRGLVSTAVNFAIHAPTVISSAPALPWALPSSALFKKFIKALALALAADMQRMAAQELPEFPA